MPCFNREILEYAAERSGRRPSTSNAWRRRQATGVFRRYGEFTQGEEETGALSDVLFGEYLMDHFSGATEGKDAGALDYELEYLLAGEGSDRENLEAVAGKLLLLRFVPNYAHLQSSAGKKAEARAGGDLMHSARVRSRRRQPRRSCWHGPLGNR